MRNNGKVLSQKHRQVIERGCISADRVTDEEREWAGITRADGQRIDPNMFRSTTDPPGSRYMTANTVDLREASPYRKDGSVRHR
ncbi:MAG: hypothetical protein A4E31_00144 [Methanomassiliicoccales archaeon PtaU1.Bin030]|nr:MAG: hypothetical protein A4E31_00144 [Methanomassiliicoccales archaeon PtaU1.Bin030]